MEDPGIRTSVTKRVVASLVGAVLPEITLFLPGPWGDRTGT